MISSRYISLLTLLVFIGLTVSAQNSVITTVHNMSAGGPGSIKATTEQQVCIFCHTPHGSLPTAPLWNKNDPGSTYLLYNSTVSSTQQASPSQPDGSSILCLSCHDGTIALGDLASRAQEVEFQGGVTTITGTGNLSTDLRNDHPISFDYTSALASSDGQLKDPSAIIPPVELENGKVQCMSCHDPHKNTYTKFLVNTNENSTLCFSCHDRDFWAGSTHANSTANWNGTGISPWAHIEFPYATVGQNACENCHSPHNAGGAARLMKSGLEEDNCTDCHNGNTATTDIQSQVNKLYSHNLSGYNQIHDPNESVVLGTPHVECEDCHNPHAVTNSTAVAPLANGTLNQVPGIGQDGTVVTTVTNQYELCYRCHSDNAVTSAPRTRVFGTNNTRLDFSPTNVSYHPVVGPRNNTQLTSLISPYTQGSMIYCTDCHSSDGAAPSGPHGSMYPRILKANYNMNASTNLPNNSGPATYAAEFALCAQCHDMTIVEDRHSNMKKGHFLKYTSCNTCHDPHGFPGGVANQNGFLVNFDTNVIFPNTNGDRFILMNGDGTGECNFRCHDPVSNDFDHQHSGASYR